MIIDRNYVADYISRAKAAQQLFEEYNQEQVDLVVKTIAKTVYDNAEMLAQIAVEETGMGFTRTKL